MSTRHLVSLLAVSAALLAPAAAQARYVHRHLPIASIARALPTTSPETVVQDDAVLLHATDAQISDALAKIRALGIDRVRVTAGWSVIAPQPDSPVRPDFDDTDPAAYPPGNWDNLDRIVRMANAAGIKVMIDIAFWAPRWATQSSPSETIRLRTNIDPVLYAHFAEAVARRYSGTWAPPSPPADQPPPAPQPSPDENFLTDLFGGGGRTAAAPAPAAPTTPTATPLPAVDIFTIWNEPNHPGFLQPQWTTEDGHLVPHSADIYRAMVMAAYPAIKAIDPGARVLVGATSSGGATQAGRSGVTPLRFLRRFACVDDHWRPISTGGCAGFTRVPGDGWSHHPYSLRTLPDALPHDPDKLPVAATGRLLAALHRLVRAGRLAPADQDVYMTEYGYETSPPDPQAVFGPDRQAQLLSWAEFIATRDPRVRMWPQFQLIDRPGTPAGPHMRPFGDWQSGLYYEDWSPKPAAASYRTPTFAACTTRRGRRLAMVWGRVRDGGAEAVTLDRVVAGRRSSRRVVAQVADVAADREVLRFLPYTAGARYQLTWAGASGRIVGPIVAPVDCGGR